MRKKMCRNDMFYIHYPYDAKVAREVRQVSSVFPLFLCRDTDGTRQVCLGGASHLCDQIPLLTVSCGFAFVVAVRFAQRVFLRILRFPHSTKSTPKFQIDLDPEHLKHEPLARETRHYSLQ